MRALLFLVASLLDMPCWAAHAYAQFGDIKYPPGFTHFDYVSSQAPKGGEIRMVPSTRPTNFDKFNPFTLKGTEPASIGLLMFDTLLTGNMEEPTTAYGLLAEDVEVAPDGMSATFRLDPKARFQNGKPVLAADVVHTFKTLISKQAAPQYRVIYAEVKDAVAVSDRVVRFDFTSANRELPLIVGGLPVFSRDWGAGKPFDEVVSDIPVVSGPYRLENPRLGGRDITYVRDPSYWAADHPTRKGQFNFDRITFKIYLDETTKFEGFKAGEYDFVREFSSRIWARQYKGKRFDSGELRKGTFESRNPGDFQGVILNLRKPKFQDIRVRKALALAMDFEWMNRQLFYGLYKRVEGYFPNSDFHAEGAPKPDELALLEPLRGKMRPEVFGPMPASPTTLPPSSLRENLRQAQALLKEAGWDWRDGALRNSKGEPFTVEFLNDQPGILRVVTPYQKNLEKIGIQLVFREVDYSLQKQRMDSFDFEMTSNRIPGRTAPGIEMLDQFGSRAAATKGSGNYWGIADPAVDALLEKVVSARTRPDLTAAVKALDRVLTHGFYSVPEYYNDEFFVGYRPGRFVLPPKVPPFYDANDWALMTWWASPSSR